MNTASKLLSGFALAIIAAAGVHAESYDGVQKAVSANSRASVRTQGAVAARSGNPFGEVAGQGVVSVAHSIDRAGVRSEAFVAARSANPYAEGFGQGAARVGGSVDRSSIRADARAAARGDQLPL